MIIDAENMSQMLGRLATRLLAVGEERPSRAGKVLEFPEPVMLHLRSAGYPLALNMARNLNPWVSLAEFPWLLAGRNDIAWLLPYLPKAADFSDDGETWRAGYGPRLRDWPAPAELDVWGSPVAQIAEVVNELREQPNSRRATIGIWDPAMDWVDSKDIPCTLSLSFMPRSGDRLDLLVTMRSNDAIWGLTGVNAVNWCGLLQMVAAATGKTVGAYHHVAHNLHVYERHWDMLRALSREHTAARPLDAGFNWAPRTIDIAEFMEHASNAVDLVMELREDPPVAAMLAPWYADMLGVRIDGPYEMLAYWMRFMNLWHYRHHIDAMYSIKVVPWRRAAIAYSQRQPQTKLAQ